MGGAIAGRLTRIRDGRLRFEYDEAYQAGTESTPLSLSMPLQIRVHDDDHRAPVVTAFLSNLLPDNDAVLARWSRRFQVPTTPFALLGTPIGEDCAGAVRFCPEDDLERVLADPGSMAWLTEADVAARLRNLKQDTTAWLGADFTGQFSLAGAQAKTALSLRDGRWALPSGAMATTHILKPAVAGLDDHDLNEHLCLDAARRAGLLVARSHLAMFEDQSAVVVERYDRRLADGQVIRIHQEDLCQALGVMPERKYQNEGGPTAGMIAELLRRSMPSQAAEESVGRFADALIWSSAAVASLGSGIVLALAGFTALGVLCVGLVGLAALVIASRRESIGVALGNLARTLYERHGAGGRQVAGRELRRGETREGRG